MRGPGFGHSGPLVALFTQPRLGEAGDFRFGNDPGSLVGAANYQLAVLISHKRRIVACKECGQIFIPDDPRQRYHKKCGNRKRQRERRERAARGQ
jgi:hypothetical protein